MNFKNNKFLRRFATALLTGTMIVSMMGMSVGATGKEEITSVPITKVVEADDNVLAPNTSFTFKVVPGAGGTITGENEASVVVYGGVVGGAKFDEGDETITFTPGGKLSGTTNISLEKGVFTKPGVYHYVITEVTPEDAQYDGVSYSTEEYNMYVYVVNDGDNGLKIEGVTIEGVTGKAGGEGYPGATFTNTYTTNNLTLTKKVEGNQGDTKKEFTFTITVNGAAGEKYATDYSNSTSDGDFVILESGKPHEITLSNGDSINIYGLSANDKYTIVEDDYRTDGYTVKTSVKVDNGEPTVTEGNTTVTSNTTTGDTTVTYTNTKNVTTPTGIAMSIMPYALMVALAGVLAFLFLRRRRTNEF